MTLAIEAASLDAYLELDRRVDGAETVAIQARWQFGRMLLAEREANGGKQLPPGRIEELSKATGKSPAELRSRAQFAEEYETAEKVATAVATFGSWTAIRSHFGTRGLLSSESNDWYTPAEYIEAARRVLGAIDLDPASSPEANSVVQATKFFTIDDDGLSRDWAGRVWLNPPYGGRAGDFTAKLLEAYEAGTVTAAITLVSANATATRWFQRLFDANVLCFTDHRISFISPHRESSNATGGHTFAYFGPEPEVFAREFEAFGAIVSRWRAEL